MSSSAAGNVTAIGFESSDNAKNNITSAKSRERFVRAEGAYFQSARNQKSAQRTFFRSEIHAADSTASGCSANSAATARLRPGAPVSAKSAANNAAAASAWKSTFMK